MKKLFLLTIICLITTTVFSQRFKQGIGGGLLLHNLKADNVIVLGYGINYSPQYNIIEKKTQSLSIGIPLSLGLTGNGYISKGSQSYNTDLDHVNSLLINVPLMINYNFGGGASEKARKHTGGFIGAGFGYCYTTKREREKWNGLEEPPTVYTYGGSTFGPTANAGVRFCFGKHYAQNAEIRASYYSGKKLEIYALSFGYNF